jgi:hypothetical protein
VGRSTLSITIAAAVLGIVATPASAREGWLTFRDHRPLTLGVKGVASPGVARRLLLCNVGSADVTDVSLSALGFEFKAKGDPVEDTLVLRRPKLSGDGVPIAPGQCRGVELALVPGAPMLDAGSYTGVISAVGPKAGSARREVTITGPKAQEDTKVPAKSVADTVKIRVTRHWLRLWGSTDKPQDVVLKAPAEGKTLNITGACQDGQAAPSATCPAIGVAAHDDDVAQLSLGGATPKPENGAVALPVKVHGADKIGDYEGTIDPGASNKDDDAIKVTVSVTDPPLYALAALLLGFVIVLILQIIAGRCVPSSAVKGAADDLVKRYGDAVSAFFADPEASRFGGLKAPTGEEVQRYADKVKAALKTYLCGMLFLDKETDTYKQIAKSLAIAQDDADCWGDRSLLDALVSLHTALDVHQKWLAGHPFGPNAPAVGRTAATILAPRSLKIGEASKTTVEAKAAVALLEDWLKCAKRLQELQLRWWRLARAEGCARKRFTDADDERHHQAGAQIAQVKRDMAEITAAAELKERRISERLGVIDELVSGLEFRYPIDEAALQESLEETTGAGKGTRVADADAPWLTLDQAGSVESADKLIKNTEAVVSRPAQVARIGRTFRVASDVICLLIAALAAIATAWIALVDDKNFGTVTDYVTVIVGGVAAQAIVAAVIPKINALLADVQGTALVAPAASAGEAAVLAVGPAAPALPAAT